MHSCMYWVFQSFVQVDKIKVLQLRDKDKEEISLLSIY